MCDPGWGGNYCDLPLCSSTCIHGYCNSTNSCICSTGWTGYDCNTRNF